VDWSEKVLTNHQNRKQMIVEDSKRANKKVNRRKSFDFLLLKGALEWYNHRLELRSDRIAQIESIITKVNGDS